ncbi:MAG: acyl-CoA synthetase [Gallionellaceae bacterium]|nr:acyl-CoA synthetase [Gallionellaceae bacterium]
MEHSTSSDKSSPVHETPDWVSTPERSNVWAMRFIVWVALTFGRPVTRLFLFPFCLYFLTFSPNARAASAKYLHKVLPRKPGIIDLFRHYHTFASTILDRVFLLHDQFNEFDVRVHGEKIMTDLLAQHRGCFLLGAHLGSFEILRSLGREANGLPISLLMYEENARMLNSALHTINPELSLQIIALGHVDSMLKVEQALDRGELVGMLGDRVIDGEGMLPANFLGQQALLPTGAFRLAIMLKRPIILMFGLYQGGNRYDVHFEQLSETSDYERMSRHLVLEQAVQFYTSRLEYYCRMAPYNWFNFYDFWKK